MFMTYALDAFAFCWLL